MGFGRLILTGKWKRQKRKPTLFESIFLGDRDNIRRHITRDEVLKVARKGLFNFGNPKCANCGSKKNLHIDHIVPLSKSGTNKKSNLQLLCRDCNLRKGGRY